MVFSLCFMVLNLEEKGLILGVYNRQVHGASLHISWCKWWLHETWTFGLRHMYIDLEGRWDGVFCVTPRTPTRRSIHRFPCDLVSVQKWEMLQSQGGFPFKSFKTLVEFEVVQRNSGQTGSQVSLSVHKWHVNKDTKHPLIQGAIGTLYLSGFRPPKKKQPEYHWFQSASMLETSCQLMHQIFRGKINIINIFQG